MGDTSYMEKNVVVDYTKIDQQIADELIINQDHLYNVIHSKVMDCNPHTKVKYKMESISGEFIVNNNKVFVVFVPSSAKNPIVIPKSANNIVIDIRSLNVKGKAALQLFKNIVSDFKVSAVSAMGKKGNIYMTPSYISDKQNIEQPKCPLTGKKVLILIDRYTLCELDEYCSLLLAYFYKHYNVKGEPHKMYKYIFKEIVVGYDRKHTFAIPVLKLSY